MGSFRKMINNGEDDCITCRGWKADDKEGDPISQVMAPTVQDGGRMGEASQDSSDEANCQER